MAAPNGRLSLAVRKGAMKARKLRAPSGLPGPQPRNCESTARVPEQLSPGGINVLNHNVRVAWPARPTESSLNALGAMLLGRLQAKLLKNATAVLGDAVAGSAAAPSARLLARRALRAAAVAFCAANYIFKVWALAGSLAHIDLARGLATEAQLADTVSTLVLSPTVGPASPPLLRALGPMCCLAADSLDIGVAVEGLAQTLPGTGPEAEGSGDLAASIGKVNDVVLGCLSLVENCQELVRIAAPGEPRADKRDGSGSCADGDDADESKL